MRPTLTMTSTNYDYDYDTVQPYFMDGEEDFYPPPRSHLLPGPSEDIWKKFELLQTAPLSSSWKPSLSDDVVPLSAADHLEMVSDLLDEDYNPSDALLQSSIIQDCMWSSSFAASTKLEKVVSERLAMFRARQGSSAVCTLPNRATDEQICRLQMSTSVDPTMVLQYSPMDEKQDTGGDLMELGSEMSLESRPPSNCDSESEEEMEDEEIDVVTVDRRKASQRSNTSPLVLHRSHINMLHHNYFAPEPPVKRREYSPPQGKKQRTVVRRCPSPRSDSEDSDRRRTHNVLERQRRNELKMSFLSLREEVPSVADNDRAPKVAILKKATELIGELQVDESRLITMKEELRRKSRALKNKLQHLRTLQ
ncbi:transcriptional regulator Myc-B-like [Gouania willdenowi]|uniref:Transcriptional regulator n=1 Tax=Gouania willdenowi TaxID=441366 RepID=A0A8C5H6I9_GOUWI|nr:transcriptional regulator Myc-B-like [Gouania willdenowi]XP_028328601.1 transcriptional regulator Myc-B-like [Gouania willdenowi]